MAEELVELTAAIQHELELARSGDGYEEAAVAGEIVERMVAPMLAARDASFDQRLSDFREEYRKSSESWDRTRERLTVEGRLLLWLHAEAAWHRDQLDGEALKWTEIAGEHAEELERWRSGQRQKTMPVVKEVPDGITYAARLLRAQGTDGGDEHDELLRNAGARLATLTDVARRLLVDRDRVEASRQAWAEEAARLEGAYVTLPEEVRVAAATISRDIYEAMDVIYGEIGGKADTAQDVADTAKVIADDIRRVLDFVASLDYHAGQRVEWNTASNQWVKATVADSCAFDGPDGRISPLLSVEVDDTGQVLNVDRRHLRQSWTSEEAGSPACACVSDEQAAVIVAGRFSRPQCAVHPSNDAAPGPLHPEGSTEGHFRSHPQTDQRAAESTPECAVRPEGQGEIRAVPWTEADAAAFEAQVRADGGEA